jgi:hypothetical protein
LTPLELTALAAGKKGKPGRVPSNRESGDVVHHSRRKIEDAKENCALSGQEGKNVANIPGLTEDLDAWPAALGLSISLIIINQ